MEKDQQMRILREVSKMVKAAWRAYGVRVSLVFGGKVIIVLDIFNHF